MEKMTVSIKNATSHSGSGGEMFISLPRAPFDIPPTDRAETAPRGGTIKVDNDEDAEAAIKGATFGRARYFGHGDRW